MVTIYHKGMAICMHEPTGEDAEFVAFIRYAAERFREGKG